MAHRLLMVVLACVVCGVAPARADAAPTEETLYLDVQRNGGIAPQVTTAQPLEQGRHYVLRISGTLSIWPTFGWGLPTQCGTPEAFPQTPSPGRPNGAVGVDAETVFAAAAGPACADLELPRSYRSVYHGGVFVNGGFGFLRLTPYDGRHTTPTADHSYAYDLRGAGAPLSVRFIARQATDDYGVLTVRVIPDVGAPQPAPAPAPGTGAIGLRCGRRHVVLRVRNRRGVRLVRGTAMYAGRHTTMRRTLRGLRGWLNVRDLQRRRMTVTIVARTARGRVVKTQRRIRLCRAPR
jgi:hypothetical protein